MRRWVPFQRLFVGHFEGANQQSASCKGWLNAYTFDERRWRFEVFRRCSGSECCFRLLPLSLAGKETNQQEEPLGSPATDCNKNLKE